MSKRSLTGEVGKSLKRTVMALVALAGMAFALPAQAADVNVLIIGNTRNSYFSGDNSVVFDPGQVKTNLLGMLSGASTGTVDVVVENRGAVYWWECQTLESWFCHPSTEANDIKPNLRGEAGTQWDYVIVIGDPYAIEYQPGIYAQGVASVAGEVAKGANPAEVILLMPWPGSGSDSSVAHYEEVVYRVGDSGGMKVAPAGLAWQDAGSPTGATHPSADGAYIAAASIYSSITGNSASETGYQPGNAALANSVNDTVTASATASHYSGEFDFQSPHKMYNDKRRRLLINGLNSSTEVGIAEAGHRAMERAKVLRSKTTADFAWQCARFYELYDSPWDCKFGFNYQTVSDDPAVHMEEILYDEIRLGNTMINLSSPEEYRVLPRRIMWTHLYFEFPDETPLGHHPHISDNALEACGSYLFTLRTSRCPLDPKPDPVTPTWAAQRIGYETAWRMGTCQTRAPGFKVTPSAAIKTGVNGVEGETMSVRFILPPQNDVVVNISLSDTSTVTLDKQTMTFTPENYDTPQTVFLQAKPDAVYGTTFNVLFDTVSDDVVYDGLNDPWEYVVNSTPDASPSAPESPLTLANGAISVTTTLYANGTDGDDDPLSYTWSKTDGPDGMSFSSPTAENPTATFYEIGTYILECGVTDGYEPITRTLRVDVLPETLVLRPADNPANTDNSDSDYGVRYELYEGSGLRTVDELTEFGEQGLSASGNGGIPIDTGFISFFRLGNLYDGDGEFGCIYHSYVDVPRDGLYTFSLSSDDGSQLKIGDTIVVDNDSFYEPYGNASGVIGLERGKHEITVKYFFNDRGNDSNTPDLYVSWAGPDLEQQQIHWDALSSVMPSDLPDAPIAYDQDVATPPDTALDITLTATDADGDGLTYEVVSQPANGTFISGTAPNLRYLPNASFIGTDSFTFKVTDDSAGALTSTPATVTIKINTVTAPEVIAAASPTTVELAEGTGGTPVAGAYFEWNASTDTDGDNTWESTGTTAYDWVFNAGALAPVAIFDARFSSLTAAYEFPAAKSTDSPHFNNFGRDNPATFECVIDVDGSDGGIFEAGSATQGVVIEVSGGVLRGTATDVPRNARVAYTLTPTDMGRFIHVVLVLDGQNDVIQLYVDGELKDERPWTRDIWTNKNAAGLGAVSGSFPSGASEADFTGKMALFRFYSKKAFSAADVTANFNAINIGWVGTTATMDGTVTDADGDSCATTWTLESGPAGAVVYIDDASAEDTTAIFYELGTYVLRLTADDGVYTVSNEVTITVVTAGPDSDSDGLEDVWELTHFNTLTRSGGLASEDQDNDGFLDQHEYLAGTDPTNGLSRLVITAGSLGEGANQFVWSWQAVTNKTYRILSKESLLDPAWATNAAGIPGVEPLCVHTVLVTGAESFFMLELEP